MQNLQTDGMIYVIMRQILDLRLGTYLWRLDFHIK
jgi:hypothetical protein